MAAPAGTSSWAAAATIASPSAPNRAGYVFESSTGDGDWIEVEFLVDTDQVTKR